MLKRLHRTIEHGFQWIETAAAIGGGCTIMVVMVLVSADAVLRRAFGAPLTFQLQLSESYLLVAMVMLSLAWGYRKGGSIQVRLLLDAFPTFVAEVILRAGLALSSIYIAILAVLAWSPFYRALIDHEVTMGVIDWPVSWSWVWVPIGCGLLAFRLALDATAPVLPDTVAHPGEPAATEIM